MTVWIRVDRQRRRKHTGCGFGFTLSRKATFSKRTCGLMSVLSAPVISQLLQLGGCSNSSTCLQVGLATEVHGMECERS